MGDRPVYDICIASEDVRRMDSACVTDFNMPTLLLMENAGGAVSETVLSLFDRGSVAVICGKGNNGGDGLVVARQLICRAVYSHISIFIIGYSDNSSQDVKTNLEILKRMNADITYLTEDSIISMLDKISGYDIIIDAIFGVGFRGAVRDAYRHLFSAINAAGKSGTKVISVDIPSGVNSDSGQTLSSVKADITVTFEYPKNGHYIYPGRAATGHLIVKSISSPYKFQKESRRFLRYINHLELPDRPADGYKGSFGHVGIIAGHFGMTGAAVLAARGALANGAGIVSVAAPYSYAHIYEEKLTETITYPIMKSGDIAYSLESFEEILAFTSGKTSVVIGPGLGRDAETVELTLKLIDNIKCKMVIDADAIFALSKDLNVLKRVGSRVVLTPHYGEMSFLTGISVSDIMNDKLNIALDFARKYNTNLVLKGADSISVVRELENNEHAAYINTTGTNGMGSGGSGDVLAGMLSAVINNDFYYVPHVVFLHGRAGELAAKEYSDTAMTSCDIPSFIGKVILKN